MGGLDNGLKVERRVEIATWVSGAPSVECVHTYGDCVVWPWADGIRRVGVSALKPRARPPLPLPAYLESSTQTHHTHTHQSCITPSTLPPEHLDLLYCCHDLLIFFVSFFLSSFYNNHKPQKPSGCKEYLNNAKTFLERHQFINRSRSI